MKSDFQTFIEDRKDRTDTYIERFFLLSEIYLLFRGSQYQQIINTQHEKCSLKLNLTTYAKHLEGCLSTMNYIAILFMN